jgi:quinoprotein glucose dehydrogenase
MRTLRSLRLRSRAAAFAAAGAAAFACASSVLSSLSTPPGADAQETTAAAKQEAKQEAKQGTTSAVAKLQPLPDTPTSLKQVRAFPNLRFRRPIVLTHAPDGSDRVFVASQLGAVQVFPNDPDVKETQVSTFIDLEDRVIYKDNENEEGLLGLVFHPKFKENGQFFVYYTTRSAPHTSVISRFRTMPGDLTKGDPASEEELLRIPQPYWNHNGGGLAIGPDGYLYIALGDGGFKDDPHGHGQNLETLLGSILRIDVNRKDAGKNYAIPADNPFREKAKAQPEIYAYGFRNVWGMAFDSATGLLWAADVGQDLWEEIDIVEKGGNYGWKLREATHKFKDGSDARPDLVEPVWEYHHDIGKSITGGFVYRGKKLPDLVGCYLYADYVSGKVWALKLDEKTRKPVANYAVQDTKMPIIAFGADSQGEAYMTDSFGQIWTIGK